MFLLGCIEKIMVKFVVLLQFSVTEHFRDADVYPKPPSGVYFIYDLSPIKVREEYGP